MSELSKGCFPTRPSIQPCLLRQLSQAQSRQVKDIDKACRSPATPLTGPSPYFIPQSVWGQHEGARATASQGRLWGAGAVVERGLRKLQEIARCQVQNVPLNGPEQVLKSPRSLASRKINSGFMMAPDHKLHIIWSSSFCLPISSHTFLAPTCPWRVQDQLHC